MQTWEYSPQYALRSYAYLLPLAGLAKLLALIGFARPLIWFILRGVLAISCAIIQGSLISALGSAVSPLVARYALLAFICSPGHVLASSPLLPSSTFMQLSMLVWTLWLRNRCALAVGVAVFATVATNWPFAALLFVPFMLDVFLAKGIVWSVVWGLLWGAHVTAPVVLVDYVFYGRWLASPLNIAMYNTGIGAGESAAGRSVLYGVESWHYYATNLLLNFHVWVPLAALGAVVMAVRCCSRQKKEKGMTGVAAPSARRFTFVVLSPLLIWLAVMFRLPHKEERFLFVIYPLISIAAACGCEAIHNAEGFFCGGAAKVPGKADQDIAASSSKPVAMSLLRLVLRGLRVGMWCGLLLGASLTVSRVAGLYVYYGRPVFRVWERTMAAVEKEESKSVSACTGADWHRYPSSFFLHERAELRFVRAGFKGLLPGVFNSTSSIPPGMNDDNREDPHKYVSISECDYLVDSTDQPLAANAPRPREKLMQLNGDAIAADQLAFESVSCYPILEAAMSRAPYRSFLIPPWSIETHEGRNTFVQMCVWKVVAGRTTD